MDETLSEFGERLRNLKIHAQGVAVRKSTGELRSLSDTECQQLGLGSPIPDLSFLKGKDFPIGGTRFKIRFEP